MSQSGRCDTDLWVVAGLTLLAVAAVTSGIEGVVRTALVVPLVTVLPGYAFVALLYPRPDTTRGPPFDHRGDPPGPGGEGGLGTPGRLVFSVLSSIVIVPLVVLGANFTPWGITRWPVLAGVALVTTGLLAGALARRHRLPVGHRARPTFIGGLGRQYTGDTAGAIALVIATSLLVGSLGYAAANPPASEGVTELYLATDDVTGETESLYPAEFAVNQTRSLPVVVANREHEPTAYGLVVAQQRTGDDGRIIETAPITRKRFTLAHGENWSESVAVTPSFQGTDTRFVVLLYHDSIPDDPGLDNADHALRLPITVETGGR